MTPISEVAFPHELIHGLGPIWSAVRIANPCFATTGPLTFRPASAFGPSAAHWRETVFAPHILPIFLEVLGHARAGRTQELIVLDSRLTSLLTEPSRSASRAAGRRLAESVGGIRGDRMHSRLCDWTSSGRTDGNLAILFAARCAAFSMPDRRAVGAYLFQEIHAGDPGAFASPISDFVAGCLDALPDSAFRQRAA